MFRVYVYVLGLCWWNGMVCVDGMVWFGQKISYILDGWMAGLGELWLDQYMVAYIPSW